MENFGEFLYALRKDKGMTQAELAQLLGVTNKAVSKWETGEAMPETSLLIPIARIFGVSVDELLDGKRAERLDGVEDGAERDSEKVSDMKIKDYLFKRGKDEVQTFAEKIQGAVCATIAFGGIVSFLLVGIITGIWHPYWVILPVSTMSCGIVGIILDLCNAKKRKDKIACGEIRLRAAYAVWLCCPALSYIFFWVQYSIYGIQCGYCLSSARLPVG